ncbi:hypothetical protein R6Q57_012522 [Mikania cordata]
MTHVWCYIPPLQSVTDNVSQTPESLWPVQHIHLLTPSSRPTKAPSVCDYSFILEPPRNKLQTQLNELQDRLNFLVWDRKELQEHIGVAIKEHEMMETILGEVEEEHNEAIHKIKQLESVVWDENLRLKELHGKSQLDTET